MASALNRPIAKVLVLFLMISLAIATLPRISIPGVGNVAPRADEHADKHASDKVTRQDVLDALQRGLCLRLEKYLSRARNTILVLCQLSGTSLWGGMISGAGTHTELTTFAAPRAWWDNVIQRDGYQPAP